MHVHAWDPADAMTSHLRPDVDVETRKKPLSGAPTVSVLSYQLVNFKIAHLARMVCLEDTRFILVRAESSYVQFVTAARVTSIEGL